MGFASPDLVAWMKRTDRDKDWPIVHGLGLLLHHTRDERAVLHLQAPVALREAWERLERNSREPAALQRPLLLLLETEPNDEVLQGLIGLERTVWETVNQERYRLFQQVWKDFYRAWKKEEFWEWPTSEQFTRQHARLVAAAERFALPCEPLDEAGKDAAWDRGIRRAILRSGRSEDTVLAVTPPRRRMLP